MCMIFYCTILVLFKCSGSRDITINQNMNFVNRPPRYFCFIFSTKVVKITFFYSSEICQQIRCHGPTLTGQILHPPQKSELPAILE
jgi:hypothetical protein